MAEDGEEEIVFTIAKATFLYESMSWPFDRLYIKINRM
jgi:hypothetical protein